MISTPLCCKRTVLALGLALAAIPAVARGPAPAATALTRTVIKPGMNFFSAEQDVEMGKEAATAAEKELVLLHDPELDAYVTDVGNRVAKVSIAPGYPYQFHIIDSPELNAFALPGGYVYVNRCILMTAADESELAGVIAHEVGHVAARHGTAQASKQMLIQAPIALLMGTLI